MLMDYLWHKIGLLLQQQRRRRKCVYSKIRRSRAEKKPNEITTGIFMKFLCATISEFN